jgi:hypothetical protein
LLEVDDTGGYIITDANGEVLDDTMKNGGGGGMRSGAVGWTDYGEIMDDLAAFLMHDADLYDATRTDSDDGLEDFIFGWEIGAWANARTDELSMLASYREDKRPT